MKHLRAVPTLALLGTLLAVGVTGAAQAGGWTPVRTLQGPFAASSFPDSPRVAMNGAGHALLVWNATGDARFTERVNGGAWQPTRPVPGAATAAGPVALALGNNEVAAVAYTTVATRYVPSKLMVTVRAAGGVFGAAVEPVPGATAGDMRLAVACDGTVTLLWTNAIGVYATSLPGGGANPGACDGQPGVGDWAAPALISNAGVGASLAELAVNDAGAAVAAWQEGPPGNPGSIAAAVRPAAAAWQAPQTVSVASGHATWNPKPGIDAAGNAALGYLDGTTMVVASRPAGGAWGQPVVVSGSQAVYYPSLAMNAAGELLVAWLALDASNAGSIWASLATASGAWNAPVRLSARGEAADWPSAAFAADGSLALVGWTDNHGNAARVSVRSAGTWARSTLGTGYWSGLVPVAAGGGAGVAGWATPSAGNPNAARLVARTWR
jgi:hypothetical protein